MNQTTLLHRQVHPTWVQQGRVTSQVFRPTPKDQKKLSVYDGDQIAADKAWEHFTTALQYASVGVVSVTSRECQSTGLIALSDPTPFPEHVVIDFTQYDTNAILRKSKSLKQFAEQRGWQFRVEDRA